MADSTPTVVSPGWHDPNAGGAAVTKPRPSRGLRLFLTLAALLAVAGAVVGFLLYLRASPNPVFIGLWITEYKDPDIPPSPYGEQDRAALRAFPWQGNDAFNSQEKERVVRELDRLREKPPATAVAVYLSGYVVAGGDGRPCLLPGNARLDDEGSWLPMSTVLDSLRACKTDHKLLILDVTHPLIAPRRGLLVADAAELLRKPLEDATKDGSLLILSSASPGQTALGSEELGLSVFGHYVRQGLLGAADGYGATGERDRRITVRELSAYVTARVDRWAEQNRAARQTPYLLGNGSDFELVTYNVPVVQPEEAAVPDAYPDWLAAGWKTRDEWRAAPSGRMPPLRRYAMEQALLRADARWREGGNPDRTRDDLARRMDGFRQLGPDNAVPPLVGKPRSLADAVAHGAKVPDVAADAAKFRTLAARIPAPGGKPEDPARAAFDGQRADFLKGFEGKAFDLAWLVVDRAAADREPTAATVRLWAELLRSDPATGDYEEVRFLERLADELAVNDAVKPWPAMALANAVHVERDGARLAAAPAWTRPWLGTVGAKLAERRQAALDKLFDASPASKAEAATQLVTLRADEEALLRQLEELSAACRTRDEALDLLPDLGPCLATDASLEGPWVAAAERLAEVQRLLAEGKPEQLRRLARAGADLAELLERLRAPFDQPRWAEVAAEPRKARPADAGALAALLASPTPDGARRAALWQAYRKVAGQLWQDTRARDQADDQEGRHTAAPLAPDPAQAAEDERRRGLFRARMAIELLKADGLPDASATALEEKYAAAAAPTRDDSAWRTLCQELRKAARAVPTPQ
jgi:hypothetical protein